MNKIMVNLCINIDDFETEDKKIIVKKGYFYFQGQRYFINDKKISETDYLSKNQEEIPF